MMDQIQSLMKQLDMATRIRAALGNALANDQQIDISRIVTKDNNAFIDFVNTDAGRAAVRDFATKFIASQ